jgi:preprotein translocase subunit SecF
MRFKWLYFAISLTLLLISIFSLVRWGLKPAVDFTGGTILELEIKQSELTAAEQTDKLKEIIAEQENVELTSLQESGENSFLLKLKPINKDVKNKLVSEITEIGEVSEKRFITVGPTIGQELIRKTIFAVILAAGFIMAYVALRFKDKKYGICAILAMFHDSLILIGTFSLLGRFYGVEVDTLFVTAVLTILSFSVHDTVVMYDRIREGFNLFPKADFERVVNKAVAESLNRSIIDSLTIIFMLLSLWLFGGETIKWFVFALLVGTILGTYSSTFTAAPLLVLWENIKNKKK